MARKKSPYPDLQEHSKKRCHSETQSMPRRSFPPSSEKVPATITLVSSTGSLTDFALVRGILPTYSSLPQYKLLLNGTDSKEARRLENKPHPKPLLTCRKPLPSLSEHQDISLTVFLQWKRKAIEIITCYWEHLYALYFCASGWCMLYYRYRLLCWILLLY